MCIWQAGRVSVGILQQWADRMGKFCPWFSVQLSSLQYPFVGGRCHLHGEIQLECAEKLAEETEVQAQSIIWHLSI